MTALTRTPPSAAVLGSGSTDQHLGEQQVRALAAQALAPLDLAGKRVLLIVPDSTRTAPVGLLFRVIHDLIGGAAILNFFHWLGAVITNPRIIGNKHTPVRRVVDRAAALVPVPRLAFCMVVDQGGLAGLSAGTPEAAWSEAADLSAQLHVVY